MHVDLVDVYNIHLTHAGIKRCLSDGFGEILASDEHAAQILLSKVQQGHYITFASVKGEVVATATGFIETKLIHAGDERYKAKNGGSYVMHIEDVATRSDKRGNGYGAACMLRLHEIAQEEGCYKIILDCSADNEENFYSKLGYKRSELCLRKNLK